MSLCSSTEERGRLSICTNGLGLETEIFLEQRRVIHQAARIGWKYLLRVSSFLHSNLGSWLRAPEMPCLLWKTWMRPVEASGRPWALGIWGPDTAGSILLLVSTVTPRDLAQAELSRLGALRANPSPTVDEISNGGWGTGHLINHVLCMHKSLNFTPRTMYKCQACL